MLFLLSALILGLEAASLPSSQYGFKTGKHVLAKVDYARQGKHGRLHLSRRGRNDKEWDGTSIETSGPNLSSPGGVFQRANQPADKDQTEGEFNPMTRGFVQSRLNQGSKPSRISEPKSLTEPFRKVTGSPEDGPDEFGFFIGSGISGPRGRFTSKSTVFNQPASSPEGDEPTTSKH
ncbi:hypothetical protein DSO57_1001655 [Entomophthora muscae]|uniref:Uncharacterized protein n=1 Tax=Entomophthora muscae TaxID=34485 RepID=A0ACC2TWJ1_9FUNG|nr:hypothetical protein DSO57_1001655 [Entomophthora muscae]